MSIPRNYAGRATFRWRAVIGAAAAASTLASADELPAFKQGLWEFTRTLSDVSGKSQSTAITECTSPSEDMRRRHDESVKVGCKSTAPERKGRTYFYETSCEVRGTSFQSVSQITIWSDSAYTLEVESHTGGINTKERLVAKRQGDC